MSAYVNIGVTNMFETHKQNKYVSDVNILYITTFQI